MKTREEADDYKPNDYTLERWIAALLALLMFLPWIANGQELETTTLAEVESAALLLKTGGGGVHAVAPVVKSEVQIKVGQLAPPAPATGLIEDVFFQRGEWVSANQPVVSILPDDRVKLRFFVPEAEVSRYKPGTTVRFSCDSCAGGLTAKISFVSSRPEFTPPIIFSRDSRDRLVFMVEALPARPAGLMPGLPVDVVPLP